MRDAALSSLALVPSAAAGGQLPPLAAETCPACAGEPGCSVCLGRGRVEVLAELAAVPGALGRWREGRRVDAAAGLPALGARLLADGRIAYGVAAGVRLVDLEPFAGRVAAEHRAVLAAWSRQQANRRARARVAIATARRRLAVVPSLSAIRPPGLPGTRLEDAS